MGSFVLVSLGMGIYAAVGILLILAGERDWAQEPGGMQSIMIHFLLSGALCVMVVCTRGHPIKHRSLLRWTSFAVATQVSGASVYSQSPAFRQ